jgi:hypothetical protein
VAISINLGLSLTDTNGAFQGAVCPRVQRYIEEYKLERNFKEDNIICDTAEMLWPKEIEETTSSLQVFGLFIVVFFTTNALVVVALRIYSRARIGQFGWDDGLIIVASASGSLSQCNELNANNAYSFCLPSRRS